MMTPKKKIAILGLGWLGLPLAKELLSEDYNVLGSVTSKRKLETLPIDAIVLRLPEDRDQLKQFLNNTQTLIINIPPKVRESRTNFLESIKLLKVEIENSQLESILFVSSTSVYGPEQIDCDEDTLPCPSKESGKILLESEALLKSTGVPLTIIRPSGLIGPGRNPINFFKNKPVPAPNSFVHFVHLDDLIYVIKDILKNNIWNQVFNLSYPLKISKKDFYQNLFKRAGLKPPQMDQSASSSKRTIISKNIRAFNLELKKNPLECLD